MRKIHKIVDKESADGRLIVILGSAGHPEVVGIQGWCGESVVLEGEEQARAFSERLKMENKPISLVAQTTVNRSIWNISVGLIKKRCTNLKIFDTICKATDEQMCIRDRSRSLCSKDIIHSVSYHAGRGSALQ